MVPGNLHTVSERELEKLHMRLCGDIDFEYFVEDTSREATRNAYRRLNDEMLRRHAPVIPEGHLDDHRQAG